MFYTCVFCKSKVKQESDHKLNICKCGMLSVDDDRFIGTLPLELVDDKTLKEYNDLKNTIKNPPKEWII